jgi:aspartyl-tRNA(Asn)/glutamyl-tRNA(Gln) amidotransferase subunit A
MSAAELGRVLRQREVSSLELTEHFLARIEGSGARLNAFVTVTAERAREDARRADAELAAGRGGPLTGVPIAHKDIFCTAGIRTTCSSRMLANFVSPYDATVVERFTAAGTVLLGKTNMDEFAMGSSNETSHFGPVRNPWDESRVPGGSSGGSAAAVAAGLAPAATGTDTGGSIRQPAALTGLTGIKPTYGRVSRYGMIAFASSLDQAGVLARSAEDAALLLAAMSGFDPRDSTSVEQPVPDYRAGLEAPLAGLRLGVIREFFGEGLEAGTGAAVLAALDEFRRLGAEVVEVSLPALPLSVPTYYVVAPAECSSNLSRFDGVRFGHRCESPRDLYDLYTRSRGEGFGDEVKRRIMTGTYVLSAGYYDAYFTQAQKVRQRIIGYTEQLFQQHDVLLMPTVPAPAFRFGEKSDDPIAMFLGDLYTVYANLAGIPAISVPLGHHHSGMPFGIQLMTNRFEEALLLQAATLLSAQTPSEHA